MALGLEAYGSGSESENENAVTQPAPRKRPPKRFAISLPAIENEPEDQPPPPKRQRIDPTGGGKSSSLFNMLPAPKKEIQSAAVPNASSDDLPSVAPFVPPSVAKAAAKQVPSKPITPAIDFFGLAGTILLLLLLTFTHKVYEASSSSSTPASSIPSSSKVSVLSAPNIPVFEPPDPSPQDEYPGYYKLPSGKWAAHDAQVYGRFLKKWQTDYNKQVRALEKGVDRGFEGADSADTANVNAMEETERMQKIHKDREERKKLTQGDSDEPAQPKMAITVRTLSSLPLQWFTSGSGLQAVRNCQKQASTWDNAHASIRKQGSPRGTNSSRPQEQEGSRLEIRCVV